MTFGIYVFIILLAATCLMLFISYLSFKKRQLPIAKYSALVMLSASFYSRLRKLGMRMKLVFVTSHKEYTLSAFDVYAYDYITKLISLERLRGTILRALSEKMDKADKEVRTNIGEILQDIYPPVEQMTKRELEVLQLMSRGLSNKGIAMGFGLTEGTVKNHVAHIFDKLQVKNRTQAVAVAKEFKLIQ